MRRIETKKHKGCFALCSVCCNFALKIKNKRMTDIKALFFDIDGTLVSFRTHCVPDSAKAAIDKARRKGIKVFISTGRPLQIMGVVQDIINMSDGCITCNGAYCFTDGQTVSLTTIARDDAELIINKCREINRACFVIGCEGIALVNYDDEARTVFEGQLGIKEYKNLRSVEEVLKEPLLQVTPFFRADVEAEIMPKIPHCVATRWHDAFIDIVPSKVDKGTGLRDMARHLGIDVAATMAFGDGGNDIPIIKQAGIGVAMGNASDSVKAAADYVTTSVDDDGVAAALRHFGVVE